MPFPEAERVIYEKNPLEQVICQLRFHPILRIDTEPPASFQEKIRKDYPILDERTESPVQLPQEFVQQLPRGFVNSIIGSTNKVYDFTSNDNQWVVTLARNFLALTSREYIRWEDFREHFDKPFRALLEVYEPSPFVRIGLRYQNVIRKSRLGLEDAEWAELLKPYIAGELGVTEGNITQSLTEIVSQVVFDLGDGLGQVRIQHGLVKDDKGEICYLIDSDFFLEQQTENEYALNILDYFNERNRRLFRWCITDRLHAAMGPQPV